MSFRILRSSTSQPTRGMKFCLRELSAGEQAVQCLTTSIVCRWLIEAAASDDSGGSDTVELQARYQVSPVVCMAVR